MTDPIDLEALRGHTPGPWCVGTDGDVIWGPEWKGHPVQVACVPFSPGEKRVAADAGLIAVAPALLAECEQLREELTTRRARDAEVAELVAEADELRMMFTTVMMRLCSDEEEIEQMVSGIKAALLPFQRSDDKGDAT